MSNLKPIISARVFNYLVKSGEIESPCLVNVMVSSENDLLIKKIQYLESQLKYATSYLGRIEDNEGHGMKRAIWNDLAREALNKIEEIEERNK